MYDVVDWEVTRWNDMMPEEAEAPLSIDLDIRGRRLSLYACPLLSQLIAWSTDATCQPTGSGLDTSRKYRLVLSVEQPTYCEGLKTQKSGYASFTESDVFWRRPFGPSLQVQRAFSAIVLVADPRYGLQYCSSRDI